MAAFTCLKSIWRYTDYNIVLWKQDARGKAREALTGVCVRGYSLLCQRYIMQSKPHKPTPFTFSIRLACQLSIYNASNNLKLDVGRIWCDAHPEKSQKIRISVLDLLNTECNLILKRKRLKCVRRKKKHTKQAVYSGNMRIRAAHLTYELVPAVQVGGSENVVSLQRFQQKVVPDAGDAVRGVRGLRRAGRTEVRAETLVRLCSP